MYAYAGRSTLCSVDGRHMCLHCLETPVPEIVRVASAAPREDVVAPLVGKGMAANKVLCLKSHTVCTLFLPIERLVNDISHEIQ